MGCRGARPLGPGRRRAETGDGKSRRAPADPTSSSAGDEPPRVTRSANGRLLVSQVRRDTPAHGAGFNVDDEILAIGDHRVLASEWSERIADTPPGSDISVLVARRGALRRVDVVVETEPTPQWELQPLEEASPAQERHREAWLRGH